MSNETPPPERPPAGEPPRPSTSSSMPRETPMSGAPSPRNSQVPDANRTASSQASAQEPAAQAQTTPKPQEPTEKVPSLPFPLQEGERVLALRRKHWMFLWPTVLLYTFFAIAPVLVLRWLFDQIGVLDDIDSVFWIIAALWVLFWLFRALLTWYRYQYDFWVVTSQRLIDTRRANPFNLTVNTADLINVQDMSVARKGILATMLDYGDIHCQTASVDGKDFILTGIPNPRETQSLVDRERDRERLRVRGI